MSQGVSGSPPEKQSLASESLADTPSTAPLNSDKQASPSVEEEKQTGPLEPHDLPAQQPLPSGGQAGSKTRPVVVVRNLTKVYQLGRQTAVTALQNVSLTIHAGEFLAVMGPSGSGKSTLMNIIGCLDRPTSGQYWLSGHLVSSLSSDDLAGVRNRLIGFVFQNFNLLGRATARKNVGLPMVYAGYTRSERDQRARQVLTLVGLGQCLDRKPAELSGGQQQRVAIARALINGPSILLADEPTGNLDSQTGTEIMRLLQALNNRGLTIVVVTHDRNVASYAKRIVHFLDGQLVSDEPARELQEAAAVH